MMTDGSSRQRCSDYVEEETKVRKNLGQLIHTVQHMPTARYRRNANTLWNLVEEIESFHPLNSPKLDIPSKKSGRKSYSRKYLDLRLYPSRGRSSSPECNLKSQMQENPSQRVNKNKKTNIKKKGIYTNQNVEPNDKTSQDRRPLNKEKSGPNNICKMNDLPENEKDEKNSPMEIPDNFETRESHLNPRGKLQRFQLRRKPEGMNISQQNIASQQLHRVKKNSSYKQEISPSASDKVHKNKKLDRSKGLKNVAYIKGKSSSTNHLNKPPDKTLSKERYLANDQASMVKTLTSYWNNLLSNEIEDNDGSSSNESSDAPIINKNFQNLARNIYNNARDKRQSISLPHNGLESSRNHLVNIHDLHVSSDVLINHTEDKAEFVECLSELLANGDVSKTKRKKCLRSSKEEYFGDEEASPTKPYLLAMYSDKSCGDNQNLETIQDINIEDRAEPNFYLKAKHAIEVMEKLIRRLKRFHELSLTSDKISLSHSLRTMLCLMTATVLSSDDDELDDCLEAEVVAEIAGGEDIASKANLLISSGYAEGNYDLLTDRIDGVEHCKNDGINDSLELVAVQGLSRRKVEDALRYLALCKDYLWTEFLYNQDSHRHSPRSFTFVIEEELLFEEDCDDDKFCYEYESEDEEKENGMGEVCKSVFDSILISLERLTDLTADMLVNNWPGSFEEFVRTIYRVLVSLLVWWVIAKEIFCK